MQCLTIAPQVVSLANSFQESQQWTFMSICFLFGRRHETDATQCHMLMSINEFNKWFE